MDRATMLELAAPACAECGVPIQRVEFAHERNADGDWVPSSATMVCPGGHRSNVERLEP